jgi:hypothetical protein
MRHLWMRKEKLENRKNTDGDIHGLRSAAKLN